MRYVGARLALIATLAAACGTSTGAPSVRPTAGAATAAASIAPASTGFASNPAGPTSTPGYAPIARTSASMTWDPTSQTILMFGGDSANGPSNVMDEWNGSAWTKVPVPGPRARDDALFVADPDRGVVVLSGGRSNQTVLTDTWEWDGTAWHQMNVPGPSPRAHAAAAYDHASKRMILYGGVGDTDTFHDTWAWDGATWEQLDTKGIPGRIPNYMAWDPTLEQLLVLAVNLDAPNGDQTYPSEVWGWTGSAWKKVADDGPSFSPLQRFVEGPQHPFLIDGGVVQNRFSLYEPDSLVWKRQEGATPPVRNGQAAAYDPIRKQLVMFGGFVGDTVFGDTWIYPDGGPWRMVGG